MSGISPAPRIAAEPTGARLLISALEDAGCTTLFGYPGGAIMPVYDALAGSRLRHILVRHEQGAAFAADGWARSTGQPGVCMATSGPGATNLITGIANAAMDSVPMVAITGQVPTGLMGTDAFQEVDILGMTLPIVKHSWLVRDPGDVPAIVAEAFHVASSGRPGPVLIDVPKDVAAGVATRIKSFHTPNWDGEGDDSAALARAEDMIAAAEHPLLYIGGGAGLAGAIPAVCAFARRTGIPSVATLKGLGAVPTDDPHFLGMLGMHGTRAANMAVQECDLLIAVGARFDDRATGKLAGFAPHARVIHFDADASEIGKLRAADVAITSDMARALNALHPTRMNIAEWSARTAAAKARFAFHYDGPRGSHGVYAPAMLKAISEAAGDDFVAACDVGQHQMWAAQHCRFADPRAHLTSGGLGAMGYGIPAGIGAKLARPDAQVVAITGDGSIMMNIQELATLKRYGIALKILLLDNASLGLVRQWQELFYDRNYSEIDLSDNPDFVQVAKAFGIDAFRVERREEQDGAIARLLAADGPCLAHVVIDPRENVWPLVAPGKANHEMMHEETRK
ncbi:MAG TPA: acetolactate synthase 2 catalytic subunit [Rhizomicrobium sp.]